MRTQHGRTRAISLVAVLVLLVSLAPSSPAAGASGDLGSKLDQVRRQRAEKASQLDVLKAKQSDVKDALGALDANLAGEQRLADAAARSEQEATTAAASAQAAETAKKAQIGQLSTAARQLAVGLYMGSRGSGGLDAFMPGRDVTEAMYRSQLSELAVGGAESTMDDLDAARQDLTAVRERAQRAQLKATSRRRAAQRASEQLQQAMALSQRTQDQLEQRIDQNLGEAAALATVDRGLATQIRSQELKLAAALRKSQAAALARGASDPVYSASSSRLALASTRSGGGPSIVAAEGNLVIVDGIKVDGSIAGALSRMIAAAGAAGFALGGSGYRSAAGQIAVRRNNCGSSYYDIWQKPSSQCDPPAARPGTSMHERGLAIDFTCNGSLITSYGSACYAWMASHALSFGFLNRRGEAWHWSPNGN
jgi:hypothetical protein